MKRKWCILCLLSLFLFTLFLRGATVYADECEDVVEDYNLIAPDGYQIDPSDTGAHYLGIEATFREIINSITGKRGELISFLLSLFGFSILIAISCRGVDFVEDKIGKSVSASVLMVASVSIFSSLFPLFDSLRQSLSALAEFFGGALAVLASVSTLLGEVSTAGVQAMNMTITLSLIEWLSASALMPLAFAFFTISFISAVGEGGGVASLAKGIKGAFMWGVGIISTLVAAIVSIQSVVASAHDSAVLRAARYAASGTIPIVGTTVASALGTLGGGLAFIKSSIGASSIAVILAITVSPLLTLLFYRLAISLCSSLLEFCSAGDGVRCFSAFRGALDVLIAVYSMSMLLCIVELLVFLKGGVA